MFYRFGIIVVRFILLFVFRLKCIGRENIPADGGVILAYNHKSYWDPVIAGITCPRSLRFMAKEELFKNPLFGGLIRALGAFPISRGKGDIGAVKASLKILREGNAMLIFPEGRRSKDGSIGSAKAGVAAIAHRAKVPVVPACISGDYKWLRKITVTYGKPIYLDFDSKMTAEETQRAADEVIDKIREMGVQA